VPPQSGTLGSQVVVMSDDGRRLASIDADVPCLWSVNDFGKWNREVLGVPGSFAPRGVNNAGMVVGLTHTHDGKTHAMTWTHGKGLARLQMPKDYVRSEALAINNAGVVVGMMDGPGDSERGPRAFVSIEGRVRAIDEGGPFFTSATAINDAGQVAGVVDKEDAKGDDRH
jgi:probable HAF family extracellular repeat protein